MRIVITGPKSSGKSSIGNRLAALRKTKFYDIDEQIERLFEKEEGVSLHFREIFRRQGEEKFRELEKRAVQNLSGLKNVLISTGGSTFLNEEAKKLLLKDTFVILLHNNPEILWARTIRKGLPSYLEGVENPEFVFCSRVEKIVEAIKPVASLVMDTAHLSIEEVALMLDYELDHRRI